MADYHAPTDDMTLALAVAGLESIAALPGCEEASPDLVAAVLEEAGRLGSQELAPLNEGADRFGAKLENGVVTTAPGYRDFYLSQYVEGGWNALPFDPAYGGQGLPWVISAAVSEIWQSASMSFALCPMLNQGAVELLTHHGTEEQKALYLPKMISGEWTGTMNLTEPQAGSDLSQIRTRAVREGDHYRITGQKIFITYGDHDYTDNIIHLVLARTPDAPEGTRGISLFVVPKVLVKADGSLGDRNDVQCLSLEHKLGIHGSPTAVMGFGENGGAIGYLVGEECRGLNAMFTMMNNARLSVGLQGVSIAERALQHAHWFAGERIQSRPVSGGAEPVAILHHPDVRRMVMTMKALTEAARLLTYAAFGQADISLKAPEAETRAAAEARVALLTPVVKAWGTEVGCQVADLAIQVFGGTGYMEETGATQFFRDARIAPIYEGTNGIQAADLVGRKLLRDRGAEARRLLADIRASLPTLPAEDATALEQAAERFDRCVSWLLRDTTTPNDAYAAATPLCRLLGLLAGGWLLVRAAEVAKGQAMAPDFVTAKQATARFFCRHLLPQTLALEADVLAGGEAIMGGGV